MQYVRSLSGSVSKTWNSINPATLSGAIDVIVVEQENGELACSPFHVRFGKFSLLRPYEKKVEFRVNGDKTDYSMKLGEGGEAFFVFETSSIVPADLQTSPLVSPSSSPQSLASVPDPASLQEPDYLDIADTDETGGGGGGGGGGITKDGASDSIPIAPRRAQSDLGNLTPLSGSPPEALRSSSNDWSAINIGRSTSEEVLSTNGRRFTLSGQDGPARTRSPPPLDHAAAVERALALSRKLSVSNIATHVTDKGDVMLDMHGYKLDREESLQAEMLARKILAEEMEGDYDIGSLIGADRHGNLWIYSSEEAKQQADRDEGISQGIDAVSDAGYSSDDSDGTKRIQQLSTPPSTPPLPGQEASAPPTGDSARNYAKTLRLTSAQLKSLNLQPGGNSVSFSVNKATCTAFMYYWKHNVPIVISDIDGTITKSDALGHVFTMIGRDWTHLGVAKLYTDIAANGYNLLYLTSRSVGQADTTRNYLNGIVQDKYQLPKGPVIMSPDRTFHALRREVYLRKPEVFKMACLRDILNLFGAKNNPFYAGFGNRLTDALSYRSVNIPSTRIFTINSYAEVSLDLLTLTKYKSSYVNMRDLVDYFFPPVSLLSTDEEYTDFNYWRESLPDPDEFSNSDEEEVGDGGDDGDDEEEEGPMAESYYEDGEEGGESYHEGMEGSYLEGDEAGEEEYDEEEEEEEDYEGESQMAESYLEADEEAKVREEAEKTSEQGEMKMKNDLDTSTVAQVKDFVVEEMGVILEEVTEEIRSLTALGKNTDEDGKEDVEGDAAAAIAEEAQEEMNGEVEEEVNEETKEEINKETKEIKEGPKQETKGEPENEMNEEKVNTVAEA